MFIYKWCYDFIAIFTNNLIINQY